MGRNKTQECDCCPLCGKHCPLEAPRCRKGEKYARNLHKEDAPKPEPPQEPAPMGIDDTLLVQLRLCGQSLRRQYRDGGSRYRILSLLLERDKIGQQELKGILDVKSGSLSELLAKLEKKSLIRRRKNDADKRNRDIVLTEAGRAWLREHSEPKRQYAHQLFSALSEEEKAQLSALLGKLVIDAPSAPDVPAPDQEFVNEDGTGGALQPEAGATEEEAPRNEEPLSAGSIPDSEAAGNAGEPPAGE